MSENRVRGVYVEPDKPAREITIDGSLRSLQNLVRGGITTVYPWGQSIILIANDTGMIDDMTPNRVIDQEYNEIIYGPFFICGQLIDDIVSLSEFKTKRFLDMFLEPEKFEEMSYHGKPAYKWSRGIRSRIIPDPRASLDFIGFWGM